MAARNGIKGEANPGSLLLVIHDFVARSADELSLAKGDRIELIERDDDFGDGWFLGRHLINNNTGLFPEVYTTPAPKGTLTGTPHQRRVSEGPPQSAGSDVASSSNHQWQSSGAGRPASAHQTAPLAQTALRTSLPSPTTLSSAARTNTFNADSPVMNETLSVIDEHITDMHTPRSSLIKGNKRDTMGSMYSQPMNRMSYIPGHETDEDENNFHTEEEVTAWSPERVAEYLEDQGVERAHCEVFREQEISGEVLLAMDQSSLFIKEFQLGPVGRRLKTWHKIKALQDEVHRVVPAEVLQSSPEHSRSGAADEDPRSVSDAPRNRSSTIGTILPRGLEPGRQSFSDGRNHTSQSSSTFPHTTLSQMGEPSIASRVPANAMSPLQNMTSISRAEPSQRPSAQSIRAMQHARRHSSIDSTSSAGGATRTGHKKQPSIDKLWQPGQAMSQAVNGKFASSHAHTASSGSNSRVRPESTLLASNTADDLDKGYFSSNELDHRTAAGIRSKGSTLTKRRTSTMVSPVDSRPSSSLFQGNRQGNAQQDPVSPVASNGPGHNPLNSLSAVSTRFGSMRSATSPSIKSRKFSDAQTPGSPIVTRLDEPGRASLASTGARSESSSKEPASPSSPGETFVVPFLDWGFKARGKVTGGRATSDAVTSKEKTLAEVPVADKIPPTLNEKGEGVASPMRTGSTTPSTETRSFDLQKSVDGQSRVSNGSGSKFALPQPSASQRRIRPKTKKATSAYTRGLVKQAPAEQISECDYSGWMKKKSGSLMTTWKSRLFILKGRRLSYYYSNDDTEEKGLIDISFHRVLPAHNEMLTGFHAAVTGAANTSSPTSPTSISTPPTAAEKDLAENPPQPGGGEDSGLFIFKLVPPKPGLNKGVSFTKPTVHYFAVNSRQEGRLWMAALMKATIDRNDDGVVTTTYNQKTISLTKARARKERPPALKEEEMEGRAELDGGTDRSELSLPGLGIGGLSTGASSTAGAADEKSPALGDGLGSSLGGDASSLAPSSNYAATTTTMGGEEEGSDALNESEREAVAMHASG